MLYDGRYLQLRARALHDHDEWNTEVRGETPLQPNRIRDCSKASRIITTSSGLSSTSRTTALCMKRPGT